MCILGKIAAIAQQTVDPEAATRAETMFKTRFCSQFSNAAEMDVFLRITDEETWIKMKWQREMERKMTEEMMAEKWIKMKWQRKIERKDRMETEQMRQMRRERMEEEKRIEERNEQKRKERIMFETFATHIAARRREQKREQKNDQKKHKRRTKGLRRW